MKFALIAAIALPFVSAPALAQDSQEVRETTETPGEASEPAEGDIVVTGEIEERKIERCRYVQITGSRFRERICMSREEMDQQVQNTRDLSEDISNAGPAQFQDDIIDSLPTVDGG